MIFIFPLEFVSEFDRAALCALSHMTANPRMSAKFPGTDSATALSKIKLRSPVRIPADQQFHATNAAAQKFGPVSNRVSLCIPPPCSRLMRLSSDRGSADTPSDARRQALRNARCVEELRMDGVHLASPDPPIGRERRFREAAGVSSRQTIKRCCGLIRSITICRSVVARECRLRHPGRRDRRHHWSKRRRTRQPCLRSRGILPAETSDVHCSEGRCRHRVARSHVLPTGRRAALSDQPVTGFYLL